MKQTAPQAASASKGLIIKPTTANVKAVIGQIDLVAVASSTCACGCSCWKDS